MEQIDALDAEAEKQGIERSEVIRQAIAEYLEKRQP